VLLALTDYISIKKKMPFTERGKRRKRESFIEKEEKKKN
jgi:hypothetical protein